MLNSFMIVIFLTFYYLCSFLNVILFSQESFDQFFESVNELNLGIMDYWNLFVMRIVYASDMLAFYLHILIILFACLRCLLFVMFCLYSNSEMHEATR